jgi:V/A-type H+-transporting ATPase subunit K
MSFILAISIFFVVTTVCVGIYGIKKGLSKSTAKGFLGSNFAAFAALMVAGTVFAFSGSDASAAAVAGTTAATSGEGLKFIAAALSTGLAAIGAGIAVAVSGSSAIGAISEDDKLLGKTIIFVGLAEGIAIYGLIISIMILGQ